MVGVVVWELVSKALEILGVHGGLVLGVALLAVGAFYGIHISEIFRTVASWTRVLVVIGVVVGILTIGGLATGYIDGSVTTTLADIASSVLGGI